MVVVGVWNRSGCNFLVVCVDSCWRGCVNCVLILSVWFFFCWLLIGVSVYFVVGVLFVMLWWWRKGI